MHFDIIVDIGPFWYHSGPWKHQNCWYVGRVRYVDVGGELFKFVRFDPGWCCSCSWCYDFSWLTACPVWSLPHRKYASPAQKIYHRDLTHPALTLQQLAWLPSLSILFWRPGIQGNISNFTLKIFQNYFMTRRYCSSYWCDICLEIVFIFCWQLSQQQMFSIWKEIFWC